LIIYIHPIQKIFSGTSAKEYKNLTRAFSQIPNKDKAEQCGTCKKASGSSASAKHFSWKRIKKVIFSRG